jgi:hypothetical protein
MRFMILIKANVQTEAGEMPSEELLTAMGKYNQQLVDAGVMLGGEGLHPTSRGARIHFDGTRRTITDGPFAETGQLICGYWLWRCESMEEAIEWAKRFPNPTGEQAEIEIRRIFEPSDFGQEFTPELRAQEQRQRAQIAQAY